MRYGISIFDIIHTRPAMIVIFSMLVICIILLLFGRKHMKIWQKVMVSVILFLSGIYAVLVDMLVVMFS